MAPAVVCLDQIEFAVSDWVSCSYLRVGAKYPVKINVKSENKCETPVFTFQFTSTPYYNCVLQDDFLTCEGRLDCLEMRAESLDQLMSRFPLHMIELWSTMYLPLDCLTASMA